MTLLLLGWLAGCGSRTPDPAAGSAAAGPPDAGPADASVAGMDLGPTDAAPAVVADASLAEIGAAPCEAVVARFLTCPGVPEESKKQMAEASRRWREEAQKSPEERARLAATCLEIARMTEQMLLEIGC
jgi:hypothetical protein